MVSFLKGLLEGSTAGGLRVFRSLDLGLAGQVVKVGPGEVCGYYLFNQSAGMRYVKFYDKGAVPWAADRPVMTLPLPPGGGANVLGSLGLAFGGGIALRATTGIADADTGAPAAGDVVVAVWYR